MKLDDNDITAKAEKAFFSDNNSFLQKTKRWAKCGASIVIGVPGWQFDIKFLKRPLSDPGTMNPAKTFVFTPPAFPFYFLYLKTG